MTDDRARKRERRRAKPAPAEPLPAEGTPDGDALRAAQRAFDAGDYARLRTLTAPLLRSSDAAVAEAARKLRRPTELDPVHLGVLGACTAFFVWVVIRYVVLQ